MSLKEKSTVGLHLRCGDCLHFKNGPKSHLYADRCVNLGKQTYSKVCKGYTPDFTALDRNSGCLDVTASIAKAAQHLSEKQLKVLGVMLAKQGPTFYKLGLKFGQPIYVFLDPLMGLGRNARDSLKQDLHYLDCYYKTYAIGVTKKDSKEYELYLASSTEGKPDWYITTTVEESKRDHILTLREFRKVKTELQEKGRVRLPKEVRHLLSQEWKSDWKPRAIDYEKDGIPTIDTAPKAWFDRAESSRKKGKNDYKFFASSGGVKARLRDDRVQVAVEEKVSHKTLKKVKGYKKIGDIKLRTYRVLGMPEKDTT